MNRLRLINKLALTAGAVFIVTILVLIFLEPYRNRWNEMQREKMNDHIAGLTEKYQNYLREKAAEINSLPVDSRVMGEIKSKILQESTHIKLYLWMAGNNDEFVFGIPEASFSQLNREFEKYRDVIKKDGHFPDQNEFLANLIVHHDKINFKEFESTAALKKENFRWRLYREGSNVYYSNRSPYRFLLSSPVTDNTGKVIGELYLKVDDFKNNLIHKYHRPNTNLSGTLTSLFGFSAFFSGLFLWFLLPAWVYTDARQRNMKNPGLWAFLSLISLIFGPSI
jgi:hypothetical protein